MAACPESKGEMGGQALLTAALLNPTAIPLAHTSICVHVNLGQRMLVLFALDGCA